MSTYNNKYNAKKKKKKKGQNKYNEMQITKFNRNIQEMPMRYKQKHTGYVNYNVLQNQRLY